QPAEVRRNLQATLVVDFGWSASTEHDSPPQAGCLRWNPSSPLHFCPFFSTAGHFYAKQLQNVSERQAKERKRRRLTKTPAAKRGRSGRRRKGRSQAPGGGGAEGSTGAGVGREPGCVMPAGGLVAGLCGLPDLSLGSPGRAFVVVVSAALALALAGAAAGAAAEAAEAAPRLLGSPASGVDARRLRNPAASWGGLATISEFLSSSAMYLATSSRKARSCSRLWMTVETSLKGGMRDSRRSITCTRWRPPRASTGSESEPTGSFQTAPSRFLSRSPGDTQPSSMTLLVVFFLTRSATASASEEPPCTLPRISVATALRWSAAAPPSSSTTTSRSCTCSGWRNCSRFLR